MRFLPLAVLALLAACQPAPPPEMTAADRQATADEVRQTVQDWLTKWADITEIEGDPVGPVDGLLDDRFVDRAGAHASREEFSRLGRRQRLQAKERSPGRTESLVP